MTKEFPMAQYPNNRRVQVVDIRVSSFFSHYGFVIRHFQNGELLKTPVGKNG
jgi:hypothetical protein